MDRKTLGLVLSVVGLLVGVLSFWMGAFWNGIEGGNPLVR